MPYFDSITDANDLQRILLANTAGCVIIKFTAGWCGPCRKIAPAVDPILARLAEYPDNKIYVIDIDENIDIYQFMKTHRQLNGIPAIMLFKAGNVSWVPDSSVNTSAMDQVNAFFTGVFQYLQYSV